MFCFLFNLSSLILEIDAFRIAKKEIEIRRQEAEDAEFAAILQRIEEQEQSQPFTQGNTFVDFPSEDSRLIQEQDRAYEESLRRDRELQRRKQEEEERKRREEEEKRRLLEEEERKKKQRAEMLRLKKEKLPPEPDPNEKGITKVGIRLPDARVQRFFRLTEHVRDIFDFIDVHHDLDQENYTLVTNYPRRTFDVNKDGSLTLQEVGFGNNVTLFVEMKL